MTETVWKEA